MYMYKANIHTYACTCIQIIFPILVGECSAFLASGSDPTVNMKPCVYLMSELEIKLLQPNALNITYAITHVKKVMS